MDYEKHFDSFNDFIELDPHRPTIISAFGKKGSGKSTWERSIYRSFPFDKVALDVTGDIDPGDDAVEIYDPLPDSFPLDPNGEPRNLHYRADPGSPTYREDLDHAVSLALFPKEQNTLGWFDEVGELTSGNRTGPSMRRLLMQSRHYHSSALFAGPRPMDVDKLIISQADVLVIYDLPDPDDQAKIAKIIAYPVQRFAEAIAEIRALGSYYHIVYGSNEVTKSGRAEIAICDPIELD